MRISFSVAGTVLFIVLSLSSLTSAALGTDGDISGRYLEISISPPYGACAAKDILFWARDNLNLIEVPALPEVSVVEGAPRLTIRDSRALLQLQGDRLYIFSDEHLIGLDISAPVRPEVIGTFTFKNNIALERRIIQAMGNSTVIGTGHSNEGGYGHLFILCEDEAGKYRQLSSINTGALYGMAALDPYIIAANMNGIQVFDARDRSSPKRIGCLELKGHDTTGCLGLVKVGDHVAILMQEFVLLADCGGPDPLKASVVGEFNLAESFDPFDFHHPSRVERAGQYLLIHHEEQLHSSILVLSVTDEGQIHSSDKLEFGPVHVGNTALTDSGLIVWLWNQSRTESECRLYATDHWN